MNNMVMRRPVARKDSIQAVLQRTRLGLALSGLNFELQIKSMH
jgi:hypothetical protein